MSSLLSLAGDHCRPPPDRQTKVRTPCSGGGDGPAALEAGSGRAGRLAAALMIVRRRVQAQHGREHGHGHGYGVWDGHGQRHGHGQGCSTPGCVSHIFGDSRSLLQLRWTGVLQGSKKLQVAAVQWYPVGGQRAEGRCGKMQGATGHTEWYLQGDRTGRSDNTRALWDATEHYRALEIAAEYSRC